MTSTTAPDARLAPRTAARPRRPGLRSGRTAGPIVYTCLTIVVLLSLFPFYWILVASSRTNAEINSTTPALFPGGHFLTNIRHAMDQANIGLALVNSTVVAASVAAGTILTSTLAGFALAHLRLSRASLWLAGILATMMVPLQLGIIPLFILMAKLNLVGNVVSVILPYLASAFGVFFMRQYLLQALPKELIEAGYVDGATTRRIFWRIVVPIARPGMAVLGMLTFMTAWNDFFWPIVALNAQNPTVQVAISQLGQGYVADHAVIMAGTFICTLPVIVAFALLGKQITGGIIDGAVK